VALQAFFDSFNVTTGAIGTTIVRTGYGFQPKAFLLWGFGRTEAGPAAGRGTLKATIGLATSATDRRCQGIYSGDALASAVTGGIRLSLPRLCGCMGSPGAAAILRRRAQAR
jgi:hypothetical protein